MSGSMGPWWGICTDRNMSEFIPQWEKDLIRVGKEQFAAELKEKIENKAMTPGISTPSPLLELKDIYQLIDETLKG